MRLPVGDVILWGIYKSIRGYEPAYQYKPTIGYEHLAQSALWWIDPDELPDLRAVCKDWDGLKLCVGTRAGGSQTHPEVITEETERKAGKGHTTNTRGDTALAGYVMVWFEIIDTERAYDTLQLRTDIPVTLRCDMDRYGHDARYKQVFDMYNEAFMYYFIHDKSMSVASVTPVDEEEFIKDMYNV